LLTVSRSFMNVANRVLWMMAIILIANKFNLFVSSVLFVFWYHSPNVLDTPRRCFQHYGRFYWQCLWESIKRCVSVCSVPFTLHCKIVKVIVRVCTIC
jgi:hypothetical protein